MAFSRMWMAQVEPRPHLVTMDLELPGMSGGDAIEDMDLADRLVGSAHDPKR